MTSRALIGEKVVNTGDETFTLKGYYPALIKDADFDEVQLIVSKRGVRRRKGNLPGILTGLQLAHCGYCGSGILAHNALGERARGTDGQPRPGARRLRCGSYYRLATKCVAGESCSAAPVERALMELCSEQSNLDYFLAGDDSEDPLMQSLASAHQALTSTEARLAKIRKAMAEEDDADLVTFRQVARTLENRKREQEAQVSRLERELSVHQRAKPSTAEMWAKIAAGVLALDNDARMKARKLVLDTFERIDIFMRGINADQKDVVRLRLTSRRGVSMELDVNRQTGERIAGDEIDIERLKSAQPKRKPRTARK